MSPGAKVLRQSHSIYPHIRTILVCFSFFLLLAGQSISAQAQTTRSFRMSLWGDPSGADVDTPIYYEGLAQPQGRSIFGLGSWNVDNFANVWASLRANNDFTRVDAALIDEPYWNVSGGSDWSNPCAIRPIRATQPSKLPPQGWPMMRQSSARRFLRSASGSTSVNLKSSGCKMQAARSRSIALTSTLSPWTSIGDHSLPAFGPITTGS
jgi:hypothetical protein